MKLSPFSLLLLSGMALGGCATHARVVVAPGAATTVQAQSGQLYTLVNLRADARGRIISVNYQQHGLVPACSPVRIDLMRGREVRFTHLQSGVQYRYIRHRSSRMPIENHAQRLFGNGCPDIQSMSDADRAGIANGEVYQGMSRQGVLIAMGYPPEHRTPSTQQDVWMYWRTSMRTVEVFFTGDEVTGLRDLHQERVARRDQRRAERAAARDAARAQAQAQAQVQVQAQPAPAQTRVDVHAPPPPPAPTTTTTTTVQGGVQAGVRVQGGISVQAGGGVVAVQASAPGAYVQTYQPTYGGSVPSCEAEVINAGHGGGATVHCGNAEPYCSAAMMRLGHAPAHLVHCNGVAPQCAVSHLEQGGSPAALVQCR